MTYTEISSGQDVEVKRCGHGGLILELLKYGRSVAGFEEGDYIIKYPKTFDGENVEKIVKAVDFPKKYKLVGAPDGVDWAEMGWRI